MHPTHLMRPFAALAAVVGLLAGCVPDDGMRPEPPPASGDTLRLEAVATGLDRPLYLTAPPGDPRLFIVEKTGRIRIIRDGTLLVTPFLDLRDSVSDGGEQGLLSMAFHPRYASDGFFYVDYTDLRGDTRIVRYAVSDTNPDVTEPESAKLILTVKQPFDNHNGGLVLFGPDGKLYIGLGDGGSEGDPNGNGQRLGTLLGKILRIDVDAGDPYAIPPDNPFVGQAGVRGEIWAYGLRNPWRFSFDERSGLLYIGDVGQNMWEEIDVAPAVQGGLNYGWNTMEGLHCFTTANCDETGLTLPVLEYSHTDGCSITGGAVYHGTRARRAIGQFFYSDFCSGFLRSIVYDGVTQTVRSRTTWEAGNIGRVQSFGEDAAGELYILSANGTVYRFAQQ